MYIPCYAQIWIFDCLYNMKCTDLNLIPSNSKCNFIVFVNGQTFFYCLNSMFLYLADSYLPFGEESLYGTVSETIRDLLSAKQTLK